MQNPLFAVSPLYVVVALAIVALVLRELVRARRAAQRRAHPHHHHHHHHNHAA